MKVTLDDLKNAYKSQIRRCVSSSREGCPLPETIFRAFDESVSPTDKDKVIDHVTACSHCLAEFEHFLHFSREEEKAVGDIARHLRKKDHTASGPGKRPKILETLLGSRVQARPLWRWAAGLLLLVVIIGLFLTGIRHLYRTPEDRERGKLHGNVHLISPVRGKKTEPPLIFRWEAIPGAESYQLEIYDESLLLLWKSPRIKGVIYEPLPKATQSIQKNKTHYWTITAWLVDGTKRESPLEEFTLIE
jgi:hypothetical protein